MKAASAPHSDLDSLPSPTGAKTLAILELLARHPEGLSAAEAARRSGFTQNLVFRILQTIEATGFAMRREDNKAYVLSNRLLELARPKAGDKSIVFCANEALRRLRDKLGETVQLLIEADGKALVLEQLQGNHALHVCGKVGMRVPLYSCAPGKAFLAWWNDEKRAEWYRGRSLKQFTTATLSRRDDLEQELSEARELGYTVDREEGLEGIHCIAAPVLDEFGGPIAAVTVMAPIHRLQEDRFEEFGARCIEVAHAIERQLRL